MHITFNLMELMRNAYEPLKRGTFFGGIAKHRFEVIKEMWEMPINSVNKPV